MVRKELQDGVILENSQFGTTIGFTRDKFSGMIWKRDDYVWIGFVEGKKDDQDAVSGLIDAILSTGYGIVCPSPSRKMQAILEAKNFTRTEQAYYIEPFKNGWSKHYCDRKDIWTKESANVSLASP